MGQIKIQSESRVGASSGTLIIQISATEKIQSYDFKDSSGNDKKNNTALYFIRTDESEEQYKYKYHLLYYYPENRTSNTVATHWVITTNFINDKAISDGYLTQMYNTSAPFIRNIIVLDNRLNLLKKDIFNRWIIPSSYPAGTKFTINFEKSYPPNTGATVNVNTSYLVGSKFIDSCELASPTSATFTIKNSTGATDTQAIQLDFDDTYSIGTAEYQVLFTRDNVQPALIEINPKQFSVSWMEGEAIAYLYLTNIDRSQLTVSYDDEWLFAYIDDDNLLRVFINENPAKQSRSIVITVHGTNSEGVYAEDRLIINQEAKEGPYIGNVTFLYEVPDVGVWPAIKANYKGEVYEETNTLILYNTNIARNIEISIKHHKTNFIKIEPIAGTVNSKIVASGIYQYNYTSEEQVNFIDFNIETYSGEEYYLRAALVTEPSQGGDQIISPIWKDTYYVCNKTYFRFRDLETNEIIYNGIIYKNVGNEICVNKILSSYIQLEKMPFKSDTTQPNYIIKNNNLLIARLEISDSNTFVQYEIAKIYNLYWNYTYNYNADDTQISGEFTPGYFCIHNGIDIDTNFANPIKYYDPRQYIFINRTYGINEYNNVDEDVNGYEDEIATRLIHIDKNTMKGGSYTFVVRPGSYQIIRLHQDQLDGEDFDKDYLWDCGESKCTNANFAVYYLNSAGLWCWMLFEGKQLESLKVNVNKYLTNANNSIPYNIHNVVYNNEIEETYTLTSVYLKDDQSKKLKDLYTSPLIYVHDLEQDNIFNVYLNTTSYDVKTFKNQGRNYYTHTIKLTKSLNKNISI